MPEKDIQELAHCLYMFDLVLREIMQSPSIADKDFATRSLTESFAKVLRREGYAVTTAKLKSLLAFAG